MLRGVVAQRGVLLDQAVELARRLGNVADLDVVGVERGRGLEQLLAQPVRVRALGLALGDEEVPQELDLEVLEAGVAKDLGHLREGGALKLMRDVGVPEAEPLGSRPWPPPRTGRSS